MRRGKSRPVVTVDSDRALDALDETAVHGEKALTRPPFWPSSGSDALFAILLAPLVSGSPGLRYMGTPGKKAGRG